MGDVDDALVHRDSADDIGALAMQQDVAASIVAAGEPIGVADGE